MLSVRLKLLIPQILTEIFTICIKVIAYLLLVSVDMLELKGAVLS